MKTTLTASAYAEGFGGQEEHKERRDKNFLAFSPQLSAFAVLSAVFLGGLFPHNERGGVGFEPFQFHPPHRFLAAETLLRVEDFQAGQPTVLVVISGDALGQMFGRERGFAERDAQRIHFGIVADFHGLKVIRIDRYHNYFSGLVHKHRAHLFGRINFPVPILSEREIFPAIQSPQLGLAPQTGADGFFRFRHGKTA